MEYWICVTCGTQFPASERPPEGCPICMDARQYIGEGGQQWTTLDQMRAQEYQNQFIEQEPGLTGIGTVPSFAIGERALLVQHPQGNVLWDCMTFFNDANVEQIERLGGITAIAISHPHFYSTMVEWAKHFDAPIYLHEANREWVMRSDEHIVFWSGETYQVKDGITLIRLGGHFPGSTVLHWGQGAAGQGVLLSGDTIHVVEDHRWVSFMYSYPNLIPLPATEVARIKAAILPWRFERVYGSWFPRVVRSDAHAAVLRSADRYIEALNRAAE